MSFQQDRSRFRLRRPSRSTGVIRFVPALSKSVPEAVQSRTQGYVPQLGSWVGPRQDIQHCLLFNRLSNIDAGYNRHVGTSESRVVGIPIPRSQKAKLRGPTRDETLRLPANLPTIAAAVED